MTFHTVVALLAVMLLGASRCSSFHLTPDAAMAALEAGDYTGLVEGCGSPLIPGFTYCRVREGDAANQNLFFVGPPAECLSKGPCVFFKIYYPSGEPAYGGSIERGKTRAIVPWKELIKKDSFIKGDRGFWSFNYELNWIDKEGRPRKSVSQGEIVLRVYDKEYIPLDQVEDDPNFVWSWSEDGHPVRMTTGARTFVGHKQP